MFLVLQLQYNLQLSFHFYLVSQITCHPPVFSDDLHISTDKQTYNYNETIRFLCSEGFLLQGTPERACTRNGPLLPPFPYCTSKEVSYFYEYIDHCLVNVIDL